MASTSIDPQVILIGIAGPSGSGKTTYANHLVDHLHSAFYPIGLDHFFYRKIPIKHPILGRIQSSEGPESLHTQTLIDLLRTIKHEPDKRTTHYHREDVSIKDTKYVYVIVEGFLLFALSDELTDMFDIRIFLDSTLSQCRMRRYRRRWKIPEKLPDEQVILPDEYQQWFDHLVWAEYLKRRDLQISKADQTFHSDDYQNRNYTQVDNYINERLQDITGEKKELSR